VTLTFQLSGLKPATTYHFHFAASNTIGPATTSDETFTTAAAPSTPTLTLSGLGVFPRKFSLSRRKVGGRCVKPTRKNSANKHCKRPITLRFGFTLTVSASVTFTLERQAPGRKVNGRCVKPTKKNTKHKKCARLVGVPGKLTFAGTSGANQFTFNGKIGGHTLGAGTYQLIATLTGGKPKTATFKIVP
jgi:hypothetical protein